VKLTEVLRIEIVLPIPLFLVTLTATNLFDSTNIRLLY